MPAAFHLVAAGEVEAIGWLLILLVLVVGGFMAVMFLRKRLKEEDTPLASESHAFSIGDLRDLLRAGKLTQEEFDRLHAKMVAKLKPTTLSLPDIRRMLQNGEITIQEYDRLRTQIVAAMRDSSVPYPEKPKGKEGSGDAGSVGSGPG